jgi:hypothetical protein
VIRGIRKKYDRKSKKGGVILGNKGLEIRENVG